MTIIEQLKQNECPFGRMTPEMQERAKEIRIRHFEVWQGCENGYWDEISVDVWDHRQTYRLRADFEETPEVVKCEVYNSEDSLQYGHPVDGEQYIAYAPNHPDFIGFLYEDGSISTCSRIYARKGNTCPWVYVSESDFSNCEVLTPTHCLFRGKNG